MNPIPRILTLFVTSFVLCLIVTYVVRAVALRWGLVDRPDGRRKVHPKPIPVAGGLAVLLASVGVLSVMLYLSDNIGYALGDRGWKFVGLALAAAVVAVVGVVDDFRGLRGRYKLFGQLIAVAIVIGCGVEIRSLQLFGVKWDLGPLAWPVTAFWLLGAINSLNLIDGMDGLLGSIGCIVCAAIAAMAFMNGAIAVAYLAAAVSGALLGFLFFNFPPASIFLGDCGSMLIGLVIGVMSIEASLKGPAVVALGAPMALMIIPIVDTSAAIVRRKLTGRSIYTTDRGHLHHVLLGRGMSNRGILLLVAGLCVVASAGALASQHKNNEFYSVVSVLVVVTVLFVSRLFGHAEFLLVKERLLSGFFALRHGKDNGRVHAMEVRLQGSADWNELWRNVTESAEQLQLNAVCLDVNAPALHEGYHARWGRVEPDSENPADWRATFPLAANGAVVGRLEVAARRDADPVWEKVALVGKLIEEIESALAGLTSPSAARNLVAESSAAIAGLERVTTA